MDASFGASALVLSKTSRLNWGVHESTSTTILLRMPDLVTNISTDNDHNRQDSGARGSERAIPQTHVVGNRRSNRDYQFFVDGN